MTLTYFYPPLGRIVIIAGWARERALGFWFRGPLNDNDSVIETVRRDLIEDYMAAVRAAWLAEIAWSPSHGESASVSPFPTRHLGRPSRTPDTVTGGHFYGEGRP
jgi:hypothetical protein